MRRDSLAAEECDVEPERQAVNGASLGDHKRQRNFNVVKIGLMSCLKVYRVLDRPRQTDADVKSVLYMPHTQLWNNLPTEIRRRCTTFEHYRRLLKAFCLFRLRRIVTFT